MSLRDCINGAVGAGEMDGRRAQRVLDLMGDLEAQYAPHMSPLEATRRAGEDAAIAARVELQEKRRRGLLQAAANNRVWNDMRGYRSGQGADVARAVRAHLEKTDSFARFSNVEARIEAIRGRARGRMTGLLRTFKRNIAGNVRNRRLLDELVDVAFDPQANVSAAARELNAAWQDAAEWLRLRFNAAGGRIAKRADWGLPQHWDTARVRRAGSFEKWHADMRPLLDAGRMIDGRTGLPFASEARLNEALRDVYHTIRTDGWAKVTPRQVAGGTSLANSRLDHRFLVFKSGAAWRQAQQKYGAADPFSAMIGHVDGMARDIALMEILGPNPPAQLAFMRQLAMKAAAEAGAEDAANGFLRDSERLYDYHRGSLNTPVSGRFARTMAGTRDFLISSQLGSAAVAAVTDVNFGRIARQMNGIPAAGVLARVVTRMAREADRAELAQMGVVLENGIRVAAAQARFTHEFSGPEWMARLSDGVLRASLLSPWTDAGRAAFGWDAFGMLARAADRGWDQIDGGFKNMLQRYGFSAADWDRIRTTEAYEYNGARFIRPDDIAARQAGNLDPAVDFDRLADRVLEMVQTEQERAVPSSTALGRVKLVTERPGTLAGEIQRSTFMYKGFAASLFYTHIMHGLSRQTTWSRGHYLVDLLLTSTLMGAAVVQVREMMKGRDPRDMRDIGFWGQALIQGGGLFIIGDIVWGANSYNRQLPEVIAGPVAGFGADILRLVTGNIADVAEGADTNAAAEILGFVKRYMPGGNLWYARLGWERLVVNRLQEWADPQARRRFQAEVNRARSRAGQNYWWAPGQAAPARAPEPAAAIGGTR